MTSFTFTTTSSHSPQQLQWSKLGTQVSSRHDSGLGSLSLHSGGMLMAAEQAPPCPPTLFGGAATIPEEQCESGVFSGGISMFCGEDADADGRVHNDQQVPVDSAFTVNTILPPSKELASMSISREPEVLRTVRMEKPVPVTAAEKTTKVSRPRVRRPRRNFSNAASISARSSSSSPPNSGGLLSLPTTDLGNNNSGVFSNSRSSHNPQSWDTGYGGSQPSSMSAIDNFSGSSAMNMSWPTIDIFELQQNVQYFLPNRDGDTGFHLAVIHGENDLLDKLLFIMSRDNRLRTVIDEQNNLYQTALHLATHLQQTEMIRKLLIAGASLNITDHKGNTPLHIAARFSSTKSLEEIIRYMSVQTVLQVAAIKNNQGLTCIHIAAKQGNMDVLRKFKSLGVNMDMQDLNSGKTALHMVVEKGSLTDVQFMLETCRANINATTYTGCTPLHIASGRGDIALTAYLLSMGANPDLATDEGDTALDLAGSDQVMTLLTKAAALRWLY